MNSIMRQYYGMFELYQSLRKQLMDTLTDSDLAFAPGGENISLGALCREIGETEVAYIRSFQTFTQDFSYRAEDPALETSVSRLIDWYESLDRELKETVAGLSEADLAERVVDRGGGFTLPPRIQLEVYKEALLIFYGKADVYVKALGKPRSEQWREWIA